MLATLAGVLAWALAGGLLSAPARAATVDVSFARVVAGSLVQPVAAVGARNGSHLVYVVERRGTVRAYDPATRRLLPGNFLDLRSVVDDTGGEQGLLGMAFDPGYRSGRPYVYVSYTDTTKALRVARLQAASPAATSVPASTRRGVIGVAHPTYTNHNGGQLLFNRDGYLYVGTGDGGGAGDPFDNARDRTSLSGKILRIDVRGSCAGRLYCIPPSNPFATSTTLRPEIWAYGLRNPWRFSADRSTGTLWVADVGQAQYEEVSALLAGAGGQHLGWPCREGPASYDASRCSPAPNRGPFVSYGRAVGASVIGGYIYRGSLYREQMWGEYVFGDFVSGRVFLYTGRGTYRTEATLPQLTAFGEGELGELYAVTYDGSLWLMRAALR
jgi:glucose/arabinose dehydrogenase